MRLLSHVPFSFFPTVARSPDRAPAGEETWDGFLNDGNGFHAREKHVLEAPEKARAGPVAEGNVGGGTVMICYGFRREPEPPPARCPIKPAVTRSGYWSRRITAAAVNSRSPGCRWAKNSWNRLGLPGEWISTTRRAAA